MNRTVYDPRRNRWRQPRVQITIRHFHPPPLGVSLDFFLFQFCCRCAKVRSRPAHCVTSPSDKIRRVRYASKSFYGKFRPCACESTSSSTIISRDVTSLKKLYFYIEERVRTRICLSVFYHIYIYTRDTLVNIDKYNNCQNNETRNWVSSVRFLSVDIPKDKQGFTNISYYLAFVSALRSAYEFPLRLVGTD